tara:strand:- start:1463 stop:1609 length:147 start_codon:yes stop_codon:yes gene_type:complete
VVEYTYQEKLNFLSHLSGDEGSATGTAPTGSFLSHLSGDEEQPNNARD